MNIYLLQYLILSILISHLPPSNHFASHLLTCIHVLHQVHPCEAACTDLGVLQVTRCRTLNLLG